MQHNGVISVFKRNKAISLILLKIYPKENVLKLLIVILYYRHVEGEREEGRKRSTNTHSDIEIGRERDSVRRQKNYTRKRERESKIEG